MNSYALLNAVISPRSPRPARPMDPARCRRRGKRSDAQTRKVVVVLVAEVVTPDEPRGVLHVVALRHRLTGDWTFVGGTCEEHDKSAVAAAEREMVEESYGVFGAGAADMELDCVYHTVSDVDHGGAAGRLPTDVYVVRVRTRIDAGDRQAHALAKAEAAKAARMTAESVGALQSRFRERVRTGNAEMVCYHRKRDAVEDKYYSDNGLPAALCDGKRARPPAGPDAGPEGGQVAVHVSPPRDEGPRLDQPVRG
jgi:ADP-ribose pyrophosphatase YjhB (NUDIX family)